MVLYKDITAASDSVLLHGYTHAQPWALELKHKSDNPAFTGTANLSPTGTVNCTSATTIVIPDHATVSGSIAVDGNMVVNAMMPLKFLPGLSFNANVKKNLAKSGQATNLDLSADMKRDLVQTKTTLSPLTGKFNMQTCFSYKHKDRLTFMPTGDVVHIGCDVSGSADIKSLQCGVAASWSHPVKGHTVTGHLRMTPGPKSPFQKVGVAISGKSPKALGSEMAVEAVYVIPEERTEMAIGGAWFLDPKTRKTAIKARVDHEGKVSTLLTHRVSDNVNLTIGVQLDASKPLSAEDKQPAKFGIKLGLMA